MMAQEGHLASTALLSGFEGVRGIDYDKPGTVYSTLFDLAIGFERLLKIIVILEHRLSNDLVFPSDAELRKLGHSISGLYSRCEAEGVKRTVTDGWPLPESHHAKLLTVLTEFASGSRYHNLDQMVGGFQNRDPLVRWFEMHIKFAEDCLPSRRIEATMARAQAHCDRIGLFGWEWGPLGRYDLTVDVTYQHEVTRLTTGHLVWAIIQTIKPVYRVLDKLVWEIQQIEIAQGIEATVPDMTEFFPFGHTVREDALRRKRWTKLFALGGRV